MLRHLVARTHVEQWSSNLCGVTSWARTKSVLPQAKQAVRDSTGIEVRGDVLHLAPELPREMERLDMRIRYRGHSLDLRLTRGSLTIRGRDGAAPPISLCVDGEICEFVSDTIRVFRLNDDATDGGTHRGVPGDAP